MGGKISAEGDVYSYGILLLGMFSGQRPTADRFLIDHSDNLHNYVKKALPHRVMEIADPRMIRQQENHCSLGDESLSWSSISNRKEVCLALIFKVGVLCSIKMPRERLDISVAIKQLRVARDKLLD